MPTASPAASSKSDVYCRRKFFEVAQAQKTPGLAIEVCFGALNGAASRYGKIRVST